MSEGMMVLRITLAEDADFGEMISVPTGMRMRRALSRTFNLAVEEVTDLGALGFIVDDHLEPETITDPVSGEPARVMVFVAAGTVERYQLLDSNLGLAVRKGALTSTFELRPRWKKLWCGRERGRLAWLS